MHFGIRCYSDTLASEGIKEAVAKISSSSHVEFIHLSVDSFQKPTPFVSSSTDEGALSFNPNPHFYEKSKIKPTRAKQFKDMDVLGEVCKEAKKKEIQVYAVLNCLVNPALLKRRPEYAQVSSSGAQSDEIYPLMCFVNPSVERYILSLATDILSNYEVAGIEIEKLHYSVTPTFKTGNLTCFCKYCKAEARNQGINIDGVKSRLRFFPKPFAQPQKIMEASSSSPFSMNIKLVRSWTQLLGLSSWFQHRRHMVSEISGRIMIASRQANPDAMVGIDLCPDEVSWIAGHDDRALGKNLDCLYPILDEIVVHKGVNAITNELRALRRKLGGVLREVKIYPIAIMSPSVSPSETVKIMQSISNEADGLVLHAYGQIPVENLKALGQNARRTE
ncbi:MAG: hypothetical protein WED05_00905 [Candidatus Atabeyarchaeum deiterrae]